MTHRKYERKMGLIKRLQNESDDWRSFYNATLVAPIRYSDQDGANYRCFGYIAVDSLNTDKSNLFENDDAKHIIGHVADLIANYFLTLSLCKCFNNDQANYIK